MNRAGAATETAMGRASRATTVHNKALGAGAALAKGAGVAVVGAGIAAAGGLALAVRAAADFDQGMSGVQAATHASAAELTKLRAAAMKAGADTKFSATEAASGVEELAKAGVSTNDILRGGLNGALSLAAAGGLGVGDAAEIAATALTQFKLRGSEVPHVADLLAAAAGKAQGEVSDMGQALAQSGVVAAGMGLSIEETTGTLAAFAKTGLLGSDAGTAFKTMIQRLQAPVGAAKTMMDKLNVSAYDSQGNFIGMANFAGQLRDRLKGMTAEQRNAALATMFGSDAVRAAKIVYDQGAAGIDGWVRKVNDQGYAAETAALKMDNLKGDVEQFGGSVETALIKLGTGSQSPLRQFVQDATTQLNKLSNDGTLDRWGANAATAISGVIDIAEDLGPAVGSALSTVGSGLKAVANGFDSLPSGVQKALVTGAVVAAGAKKLGLTSLIGTATQTATGGGLGAKGGVVPVFVTNMVPGTGLGGLDGSGGKAGKGGKAALAGSLLGKGLGAATTLTVGAMIVKSVDKSLGNSILAGAGVGALAGAQVAGPAGAAVGGAAGAALGAANYKNPNNAQWAYADAASPKNAKNVQEMARAYSVLSKEQAKLTAGASGDRLADLLDIPGPVRENADKMANLERKIGEQTGLTTDEVRKQLPALEKTGTGVSQVATTLGTSLGVAFAAAGKGFRSAGLNASDYREKLQTLPAGVQTKITTPGAVTSQADVEKLAKQYDLTPSQVRTLIHLVGANEANADVSQLTKQYGLTPRKVTTIVSEAGADRSEAKIDALAKKYHLTPKQIRTLLVATDNASGKADRAKAAGAKFAKAYQAFLKAQDNASPHTEAARRKAAAFAKAYLATLKATNSTGPGVAAARAAIASVHDRTVYIKSVFTRYNRSVNLGAGQPGQAPNQVNTEDANGGIHEAGVGRVFAGGGFTDTGVYVPRVPQMRQGGGNVLWSEPETGWEAYISGKPGMRDRNLEVLSQAATRLGATVEYANGGITRMAHGGTLGLVESVNNALHLANVSMKLTEKRIERLEMGKENAEQRRQIRHLRSVNSELEKFSEKLKTARSARAEYATTVSQAYIADPFTGTLGGFDHQVGYEKKKLRGTETDLRALKRKGLSGALFKDLAASGNATLIDQFAGLSRSDLAKRETSYNTRNRLARSVGSFAANTAYAKELGGLTREVKDLRQELVALRKGGHVGNHVTNFNGNMKAKDSDALVKKWDARQRAAASLARHR